MGMGFAPTWLRQRQVSPPPPASHDHLNHWDQHAEFDQCWSNGTSKNKPSRPAFLGHSRSLNVTRIDWLYDFLSVIHSNHGSGSYSFRHKRRFRSKIVKKYFPTLDEFNVPAEGIPNETVTAMEFIRQNDAPTGRCKMFYDLRNRLNITAALNRQTDRQTDGQNW